jgi:hypothetical protein
MDRQSSLKADFETRFSALYTIFGVSSLASASMV